MTEKIGKITKNIGKIFDYAKTNFRTEENYKKIEEITKIVREEFNC